LLFCRASLIEPDADSTGGRGDAGWHANCCWTAREAEERMTGLVFGFVGIGDMGGPMAMRMVEGGVPLVVFDVNDGATRRFAERGVAVAASPADLATRCDAVFSCLPTPAICLAVARDIATAPRRRAGIYVETSTVGVDAIREIGAVLADREVALLDSPVSGGPRAIPAGKLTCFVSGPANAVAKVRPAYDVLADRFFHLGEEIGLAQAMKVGNNLLAAANLAVTSEVVRMLELAGILPATAIEIINVSTGRNRASEELFPKQVLTGEFKQGAKLEILAKDTQLAVAAARHYGAGFPLGTAIRDAWGAAVDGGFSQDDITRIYDWTASRNRTGRG
jgi:3-hydroxyisobutyrate dehydrogenase-like beta-hydroxyacid dehydrogenase